MSSAQLTRELNGENALCLAKWCLIIFTDKLFFVDPAEETVMRLLRFASVKRIKEFLAKK